ncbi:hypothetical protein B0H14DRAFT_2567306 [Mycena olivaceomarginata]|nr:hypothetical protein B0H14DRAFT_2567306 [Mycena olivaceomarginata]
MGFYKTLEGWDEKTRGMGKSEFNLGQDIRRHLHISHILRSVQVDHGIPMKPINPLRIPSESAYRVRSGLEAPGHSVLLSPTCSPAWGKRKIWSANFARTARVPLQLLTDGQSDHKGLA